MLKEKFLKKNWRIRILWGLGILIVIAVVSIMFGSFIIGSSFTIWNLLAVIALILLWLAFFLEDIGIPLAFLTAGLILLFMTVFDIGSTYGAPFFISAGSLLGGAFGGIVGGVLRKLTKKGKAVSVVLTIIGAIIGAFFGFSFMAFSLMGF